MRSGPVIRGSQPDTDPFDRLSPSGSRFDKPILDDQNLSNHEGTQRDNQSSVVQILCHDRGLNCPVRPLLR
jgi:hypothetical protein